MVFIANTLPQGLCIVVSGAGHRSQTHIPRAVAFHTPNDIHALHAMVKIVYK